MTFCNFLKILLFTKINYMMNRLQPVTQPQINEYIYTHMHIFTDERVNKVFRCSFIRTDRKLILLLLPTILCLFHASLNQLS